MFSDQVGSLKNDPLRWAFIPEGLTVILGENSQVFLASCVRSPTSEASISLSRMLVLGGVRRQKVCR